MGCGASENLPHGHLNLKILIWRASQLEVRQEERVNFSFLAYDMKEGDCF